MSCPVITQGMFPRTSSACCPLGAGVPSRPHTKTTFAIATLRTSGCTPIRTFGNLNFQMYRCPYVRLGYLDSRKFVSSFWLGHPNTLAKLWNSGCMIYDRSNRNGSSKLNPRAFQCLDECLVSSLQAESQVVRSIGTCWEKSRERRTMLQSDAEPEPQAHQLGGVGVTLKLSGEEAPSKT